MIFMQKPLIFSSDGIRGNYGDWPLTSNGAWSLGVAVAKFAEDALGENLVVVARDTRYSGETLSRNFIAGLSNKQLKPIDLGIVSTPLLSYVTRFLNAKTGIMISASHSPHNYNGFKWVNNQGYRLQTDAEDVIAKYFQEFINSNSDEADCRLSNAQPIDTEKLIEQYCDDQIKLSKVDLLDMPKVVIDCANGGITTVVRRIFKHSPNTFIINDVREKTRIINDHCGSEHARQHPEYLMTQIRAKDAKYGFAFDGDGDRLVAMDDDGKFYNGDDFLFLLSKIFRNEIVQRNNAVVTTDMVNTGLLDAFARNKIQVVQSQNGDKYLEKELQDHQYYLGSEQVGNILINDGHHASADPLFALLVMLKFLVEQKTDIRELVSDLEKHPQILAFFKYPRSWASEKVLELADQFIRTEISSVTIFKNTRIIRWCSTTEPGNFNIMIEGKKDESINTLLELARSICKNILIAMGTSENEINLLQLSG